MKRIFLCVLLLAILVFPLSAQNCTKEFLRQQPGTWKAGLKGSAYQVNAADLVREKTVLAGIHKMISTNYNPVGCQITYANVFSTQSHFLADPYQYGMYILRFLCDPASTDKTKSYVDVSTPTTVNITANAIYTLNNLYASDLRDDPRGYLKMKVKPIKVDGFYYMGEEVVGDSHLENKIKEYRWLITYDDRLPFSYVSRKEYLLIQKKRLEKRIQESSSEEKYLKPYLNRIDEFLKKGDSELSIPAICIWNDEEQFERFVDEGTKGSFIAVKPNLEYYKKLPRSSPQFFSVVYKISHGDPVFEDNIAAIKKAIDFAALQNMLGK
ncbi:MAG: hypothetical protein C0490_02995 [Marivirga sp.]|nr:hypothetical protein [Marivirga sp.]